MKLYTPRGVKDFLPEDAYWKYLLEQRIRKAFVRWGYQEVITPTFEFFETLNIGSTSSEQTYKFLDQEGQLLALRPDITTPIARMVTTRFINELKPLRFFYLLNVFRHDDVQVGRQREFYQAGVELIGSDSAYADAEVVALAIELFKTVGVLDFQLDIGQVDFFNGIMNGCVNSKTKADIRNALLRKDFVGLRNVINQSDLKPGTKKVLMELPRLRGRSEILDVAASLVENDVSLAALENIKAIYELLESYNVSEYVYIDLSMVKSLDYYTGMVLEGYAPNLGFTLCTGGRYDNLNVSSEYKNFATGFAMGLERLMLVLERQGHKPELIKTEILVIGPDRLRAAQYVAEQRNKGVIVEWDVLNFSLEQATEYAKAKGIKKIMVFANGAEQCISIEGGEAQC
ncbi:MAG: ATP phosphoribosyltransferase regulatory subunit [Firmicutes bacterium]|nr:ATP phosphoribosyltransferase regulatory subunit [Bacillota bacterium]